MIILVAYQEIRVGSIIVVVVVTVVVCRDVKWSILLWFNNCINVLVWKSVRRMDTVHVIHRNGLESRHCVWRFQALLRVIRILVFQHLLFEVLPVIWNKVIQFTAWSTKTKNLKLFVLKHFGLNTNNWERGHITKPLLRLEFLCEMKVGALHYFPDALKINFQWSTGLALDEIVLLLSRT